MHPALEDLPPLVQALLDHMEAVLKILGLEIGGHRRPQPATIDEGELLHSVWNGTWCNHRESTFIFYSYEKGCPSCGCRWKRRAAEDTPWELVRGEPHLQE